MGIKNKSFTLIEMVVVVGVLGFALPVLFSIIFLIIQQQARIYSLQELKRQGDSAFYNIQTTVKQYAATITDPTVYPTTLYPTIVDVCPIYPTPSLTPAPFLYMFDKAGVAFSYTFLNDKIASNSPGNAISDLYLTNDRVIVSDLLFSCYHTNQYSPAIISASFKVTEGNIATNAASMQYSTKFQLHTY